MICDALYQNKEACEAYAKQDNSIFLESIVKETVSEIFSNYLPDKEKVHVALGVGSGLDYRITEGAPNVARIVGVDYSPHMLEICKRNFPKSELVLDDLRNLDKLKSLLKGETKPVIYTLLTNTLGNFDNVDERMNVVKAIDDVMKERDLLVAELYKKPELLPDDPGLVDNPGLRKKVFLNGKWVPLEKLAVFRQYMNSDYTWFLHAMAQQDRYIELDTVRTAVGNFTETRYHPDTGDIVIYKMDFGNKPFLKPMIISHRWDGMDLAKTFWSDTSLMGLFLNFDKSFLTLFVHDRKFRKEKDWRTFWKRYYKLFRTLK